jgi:hypothetical protein
MRTTIYAVLKSNIFDIIYRRDIILMLFFSALLNTRLFHLNMQFYTAFELLSQSISFVTSLNCFKYI